MCASVLLEDFPYRKVPYVRLDIYLFGHIPGTFKTLLVVVEAVSQ